jgi:hypothetical protein
MDLRDDIPTNLADLSDWLRQIANVNEQQPAPLVWAEIRQGALDRAHYLDAYVIERVPAPPRYLALEKFETPAAFTRQTPELIATVAGANGDHALRPETEPEDDFDRRPSALET